jgi:hypothetical protein
VTGQRSNQLNYVPSFVGKLQIQAYDCWADDSPDNLNSLTDDRLAVISAPAFMRYKQLRPIHRK